MNILFVRNVDISITHHINCEIQLVKAFNNLGHKAELVGIGKKNNFGKEIILLKSPFNRRRFFLIKFLFFLPIYCISKKINVVIVDTPIILGTLLLVLLKKILSIKIILDVRSIPVEDKLPIEYKLSCNLAQRFFNGATFITTGTEDYIEKLINKKFRKSAIFPSAVNPSLFSKVNSNNIPQYIKDKIKDRIVLFYHGSISPNRGINLILDAITRIKAEIPNILFLSLSSNNNYIRKYFESKRNNLDDHFLLLDIVKHEQVPSYIELADLCIVPLPRIFWWEISSPLKVMEYLAMEKPIILSDIEAHKSILSNNPEFALYFNPDIENDITNKILSGIKNLDYLKSKTSMGRDIILKHYTWQIQAKVIENFIKNI